MGNVRVSVCGSTLMDGHLAPQPGEWESYGGRDISKCMWLLDMNLFTFRSNRLLYVYY